MQRTPLLDIRGDKSRLPTSHIIDADGHQSTTTEPPDAAGPENDFVFAERYLIERQALTHADQGFYAKDLSTGQRVLLRFCSRSSRAFERLPRLCHELQGCKHVCKLIDTLPGTERLPPCFVFEGGACTLAQRLGGKPMSPIDQLAAAQSILEALCDLHQREFVHGNLRPSNVVWSTTDFCWKFIDIDFATRFGDPIAVDERTATRYTAPEIQHVLEDPSLTILSKDSVDMWSFGLMAFEIFTGTSIMDSDAVKRYVTAQRESLVEQIKRDIVLDTVISRKFFKPARQRLREFELILRLIANCSNERPSALMTLESDVFDVDADIKDPMQALEDFFDGRGSLNPRDGGVEKWLACHVAFSRLELTVDVQRYVQRDHPEIAFHECEPKKTKKFIDDYLPRYPVHIIPTRECFRLHISIARDRHFRFPVEEILSIKMQPPDDLAIPLEFIQCNGGDRLDAVALVDPSKFQSQRLNTKCPIFGLVDAKYVCLLVHTTFRLGDGFPYNMDAVSTIYLQLKRRRRQIWVMQRWYAGMQTLHRVMLQLTTTKPMGRIPR